MLNPVFSLWGPVNSRAAVFGCRLPNQAIQWRPDDAVTFGAGHDGVERVGVCSGWRRQVGVCQVGVCQVGFAQVGVCQVGVCAGWRLLRSAFARSAPAQVGVAQVGASQVGVRRSEPLI